MNYKSKYIIVHSRPFTIPIVFTDMVGHDDIARAYGRDKVVSAGFCYINDQGEYVCYGESVSLRLKSKPEEDSKILNKYLGVSPEEY